MPKLPKVYVEMVNAELITDTDKGIQFAFGDGEYWAPKAHTKLVDGKVYVEQWLANTSENKWHGEYVPGTRHTRMQSVDKDLTDTLEEAVEIIERQLNRLQRALKKRKEEREPVMVDEDC